MRISFSESRRFFTPNLYSALIALSAAFLGAGCSSSSDGDSSGKDAGAAGESAEDGGSSNGTGGSSGTATNGGTNAGGDSSSGGNATGGDGSGGDANGGTAGFDGTNGGSGGDDGASGAGGSGGTPDEDTVPPRPLNVNKATACNCTVSFSATDLDPEAGTSSTPTHAGDTEKGRVDTTKPIKGKLVMTFGGIGGGPGQGGINGYAEGLGFHTLQIAMQTNISSAPDNPYKNTPDAERTDEDNRQMGDARMEAWDGVDRVDWLDIKPPDAVVRRTQLALQHMQQEDPGGDWAYYLNADGSVRWSDVWLVGYSYGSQTLAVVAKYVRIGRGIATSGPADEGFPHALWITHESATPLERMYMLVGTSDVGNKIDTVQHAGWLGAPLTVQAGAAPDVFADNPHILVLEGQGHSEFCAGNGGQWKNLCDYAFGALTP